MAEMDERNVIWTAYVAMRRRIDALTVELEMCEDASDEVYETGIGSADRSAQHSAAWRQSWIAARNNCRNVASERRDLMAEMDGIRARFAEFGSNAPDVQPY
jgi:hypothetical protein